MGTALVFLGAAFAVILSGMGSAKGVGLVGEAGAGVVTEDPSKFGKILALQVLPGTQGLYGIITAFLLLSTAGVFSGNAGDISWMAGLAYFGVALPVGIVGYFSAVAQGRAAAAGVCIIVKKPEQNGKAFTFAAMVETYAVLALVFSLIAIINIPKLGL